MTHVIRQRRYAKAILDLLFNSDREEGLIWSLFVSSDESTVTNTEFINSDRSFDSTRDCPGNNRSEHRLITIKN